MHYYPDFRHHRRRMIDRQLMMHNDPRDGHLRGRIGPAFAVVRASSGSYCEGLGVLQTVGNNIARRDHNFATGAHRGLLIEPTRINSIENNTMVGAATGTPGTLPTRWLTLPRTTTQTIVEKGTLNGVEYIDLKFTGTPNNDIIIWFEDETIVDALTGEDWTISAYMALVGGDFTNIDSVSLIQSERTEAGAWIVTQNGADRKGSLTSTLQYFKDSATLSGGGTTAHIQPGIVIRHTSGAVDLTLRIGLPQEEEGKFATSPIKTTNAGTVTRLADSCSITDMSPFNRSQGTFQVGFSRGAYTSLRPVIALQVDGGTNTGIELNTQFEGINARVDFNRASGQDTLDTGLLPVVDQEHILSFAYAVDDIQSAGDGIIGGSDQDTMGEMYTAGANVLNIGFGEGQNVVDSLHLQFIKYWRIRKANAFL